ncbi:MAG TPA: dephospho-CoA kinase [Syntrophomonadaceae bacterium]|nr:dephospho-CoA kinase [Syntrophomonadaceae bacterium]
MRIIGLTGGIASGKSTVKKALEELGAVVISGDDVAHEIMMPGKPAWADTVEIFGEEILNPDQTINRAKLGSIVFNDSRLLKELDHIAHPRVMEHFKNELQETRAANPNAIVVMEIPLLYEAHMDRICDEVWVVWVDRETQITRLMNRNELSREDAIKRIESQMSLEEKAQRADRVLDNTRGIEETITIATRYFNEIIHNA